MKKLGRKIKKHKHILLNDGILVVECPTKILAISNVGLVNGLSEEILLNSFAEYGEISDILMPPDKSYCFVIFNDLENAITCFTSCNGKLNIAQDSKPIYLYFVEYLPKVVSNKIWNNLPAGLLVIEDFITAAEEEMLVGIQDFNESGNMKHRQVNHYGYEFKYGINNVDRDKPLSNKIPSECNFLWHRLSQRCSKFEDFIPDQLTVNKYEPGQGIPAHVDTHSAFIDPLMSLSLGSSILMEFKNDTGCHYCVTLPRRSLTIMSEESRYLWTHSITPRKYDIIKNNGKCDLLVRSTRISYTFRKLRSGECNCKFASKCDSFLRKQSELCNDLDLRDNEIAAKLERTHVHEVYENIADHFSETRHKPWPNIEVFIKSLEKGSILVDIGCGNGKYLGINNNIFNFGCDRSFGLVDLCKNRGFESLTCDCLSVPIRDNIADACICIAVIHHLATNERRLRAIEEIARILRPGGNALIYVWAKDQLSENKKSNYIKEFKKDSEKKSAEVSIESLSVEGVCLPVHTNRTEFKHKDLLVPWKMKETSENKRTFLRFYHVYEENELKNACLKLPNIKIVSSYYDQGNWCVKFQKV